MWRLIASKQEGLIDLSEWTAYLRVRKRTERVRVCVCERERERDGMHARERVCVCMCVCVCLREREKCVSVRVSCLSQHDSEEKVLELSVKLSSILLGRTKHWKRRPTTTTTTTKCNRKRIRFFVEFNAQSILKGVLWFNFDLRTFLPDYVSVCKSFAAAIW